MLRVWSDLKPDFYSRSEPGNFNLIQTDLSGRVLGHQNIPTVSPFPGKVIQSSPDLIKEIVIGCDTENVKCKQFLELINLFQT